MQHRGWAAFLRKTCVTSKSFERHLGELPYQRPMASRFANDTGVQIANPVSFLAQKILIHRRRNRDERAKDILYMHDTIDTFATRIDDLGRGMGQRHPAPVARKQCMDGAERSQHALRSSH
jgi:hypothetical protein